MDPLISFVGAGPGAADLITLRGADRLARADIVIWASSLVPEGLLAPVSPQACVHDSAAMTLEDILGIYESAPDARIVRLHSGDPSIYGAIHEQIAWCVSHERPFEVVPGVSSLGAAAAALGAELTIPTISQSVVLTRLGGRTAASMPSAESVSSFATHGTTMAVFLSGRRPRELQDALLADGSGYRADTPAAIVVRATWPTEEVILTTVGDLARSMRSADTTLTALVLVGPALAAGASGATSPVGRSHLYSPGYSHRFRKRSDTGSTRGRPTARFTRERGLAAPGRTPTRDLDE